MVVLILENVPVGLRGELTRWMLEPKAGVFVGAPNALVRDKLWEKVVKESRGGGCIMLHSNDTEQRYDVRMWGNCTREAIDMEGLKLIRRSRRDAPIGQNLKWPGI